MKIKTWMLRWLQPARMAAFAGAVACQSSFAQTLEGFEAPVMPATADGYAYSPSGSSWIFGGTAGSGIQRNGSAFGAATAPEGQQTAFLTGENARVGKWVYLNSGVYTISFSAARRAYLGHVANPIQVRVNNIAIGNPVVPADTNFQRYSTSAFPLTTNGWYLIELTSTVAGGHTTFVDAVRTDSQEVAAAGRIFYSDLDSGPNTGGLNDKGAIVTINGKNFGATQGTSTVTVGGGAVDNYLSWSDTKVVVQLGAAARSGNIVITNASGVASNGIPFTVRPGAIYFVAPNGSGNGTYLNPMSPTAAYAAIAPGATFYFRQGSYNGRYGANYSPYNYVLGRSKGGVAGQPVAFVGYPGETATFAGAGFPEYRGVFTFRDDDIRNGDSAAARADHVTIANLRMVCRETCLHSAADTGNGITRSGATAIRVVGNVMSATYTWNTGTGLISVGNDGWRIFGNELKDTGTTPPINNNHAIYIQVGASDVDVGWNYLHDLKMGHLIQVHTDTASTHENVRIHDNLITAANPSDSRGINVGKTLPGSTGSIYNNVLHNLGQDFSAIAIYSGSWNIFNNTLHAIKAPPGMILVDSDEGRRPFIVVSNNIFYSDGISPYIGTQNGTTAAQVSGSNNLFFNRGGAPAFDRSPVAANPLFVNPGSNNFRLQASSPAINRGSSSVAAVVNADPDGIIRPQQGLFDIGAFEYAP